MGKIDPPPYNNRNVMAEHYSSRVDRYTPVHGSLYSNNMLKLNYLELNNLIPKQLEFTLQINQAMLVQKIPQVLP